MWIMRLTLVLAVIVMILNTAAYAGCNPIRVSGPSAGDKIGGEYHHTLPSLKNEQVVLTFDDGPNPHTTPQILKILRDNCVSAVFFLIGENASRNPQLVRQEIAEGHSVGSHSWSHPQPFGRLNDSVSYNQIENGRQAGLDISSQVKPWFRYPGFSHNPFTENLTSRLGLTVWEADIDPDDWKEPGTQAIVDRIISRLQKIRKGIIVLHDIHKTTVNALPTIIQSLRGNGYTIVGVN